MWTLAAIVALALAAIGRRAVRPEESTPAPREEDWSPVMQELKSAPGHRLIPAAADAFDAAAAETSAPRVTSSFRTRAEQERLYALYLAGKGNLAAPPGKSLHESGRAVDARGTPAWEAAMVRHGFHRPLMTPGPNFEPWHWEFKR